MQEDERKQDGRREDDQKKQKKIEQPDGRNNGSRKTKTQPANKVTEIRRNCTRVQRWNEEL
jgi:hypothetical protein